jgi:ABC-type sugar transport system permease subunit
VVTTTSPRQVAVPPVGDRPAGRSPAGRSSARRRGEIALFLGPALLLYAAFVIVPMLLAGYYSLFNWNGLGPLDRFIGLDNYTRALGDPLFWRSLSATLGYTVVTVAGQLVLGLGAALLLNQRIPGRSVLRMLYYLPVITSWVIVSLVFLYLYNGQAGALTGCSATCSV